MARWDDGYVTDVVYTSNFYRETTPAWLATAALLLGHRPPDLTRPFRYADLGCAHGFTALTVAATCPHAEVWGFDFNPAHIESARDLAARAGLGNVRFVEASFADLAARSEQALPEFDFMVTHGVLSWVSPANQRLLTGLIGQRLRPGGLAYVSYNVSTGWAGMAPLRRLMRMLADASPDRSDQAVPGILAYLDRMKAAGALFMGAHPALEARLKAMREQDARYVAHEFLNQDWQPLMFDDVATLMGDAKCGFIGSATLSENIDGVTVPAPMVPLLAEARDQRLRETLRDFGSGQGFRRDLYRRGTPPMPMAEHHGLLDALSLAWTGQAAGEEVTIATPMGSLTGRPDIYRPLLAMLEAGPLSIRQARSLEPFASRPLVELLQAVSLLITGGYAHPVLQDGLSPAARQGAAALNRAVAALNADGGDMPRLVAPAIGSAMNVDLLETLTVGEILAGRPAEVESLSGAVLELLTRAGRSVQRDGKPVADPVAARSILAQALTGVVERRLPVLRALGVVEQG
jgi:SAM-dependent methyltransferase